METVCDGVVLVVAGAAAGSLVAPQPAANASAHAAASAAAHRRTRLISGGRTAAHATTAWSGP